MTDTLLAVHNVLAEYVGEHYVKRLSEHRIWVSAGRCQEYAIALACATHNVSASPEARVRFELCLVFPPVYVGEANLKTDTVLVLGEATPIEFATTLEEAFEVEPQPSTHKIPAPLLISHHSLAGRFAARALVAFVLNLVLSVGLALKDVYLPTAAVIVAATLSIYVFYEGRRAYWVFSGKFAVEDDYEDDEEGGER